LAIIFLSKISDSVGQTAYAVTNLSRGVTNTIHRKLNRNDLTALEYLSKQFYRRVKPDILKRLNIVPPYSSGNLYCEKGHIPFFITPFIGRSEGYIQGQFDREFDYILPSWINAIDWDEIREFQTEIASVKAEEYFSSKKNEKKNVEFPWPDPNTLFDFWALVYILSGNRFPLAHQPNAGDFIFDFWKKTLTAITIRGGLSPNEISVEEAANLLSLVQVNLAPDADTPPIFYHPYTGQIPAQPDLIPSAWRINTTELLQDRLDFVRKNYLIEI
jgi:hypothetical protein